MAIVHLRGVSSSSLRSSTSYRDSVFIPIDANTGTFDIRKMDASSFKEEFTSGSSTSYICARYLAERGFNVVPMRMKTWKSKIVKYIDAVKTDDGSYEASIGGFYENGSSEIAGSYESFSNMVANSFARFTFFGVTGKVLKKISFFNADDGVNAVPSIVHDDIVKIYDVDSLHIQIADVLEGLRLSEKLLNESGKEYDTNYVEISVSHDSDRRVTVKSNNEFRFEFGYDYEDDYRSSVRMFQRELIKAEDFIVQWNGWWKDYVDRRVREKGGNFELPYDDRYGIVESIDGENIVVRRNVPEEFGTTTVLQLSSTATVNVSKGDVIRGDTVVGYSSDVVYPRYGADYDNTSVFDEGSVESSLQNDVEILTEKRFEGTVIGKNNYFICVRGTDGGVFAITKNSVDSRMVCMVNVGDVLKVGRILFAHDSDRTDRLNITSYASTLRLPETVESGDYFAMAFGARECLFVFTKGGGRYFPKELYASCFAGGVFYIEMKSDSSSIFDVVDSLAQSIKSLGFGVEMSYETRSMKITSAERFRIVNISSEGKFQLEFDRDANYDVGCMIHDKSKVVTFYSKYPQKNETIYVDVKRDYDMFPDSAGYLVKVRKMFKGELLRGESFLFQLKDGSYDYTNVNSTIVDIVVHDKNGFIDDGTYELRNRDHSDLTNDMVVANLMNEEFEKDEFEIIVDGGFEDESVHDELYGKFNWMNHLMIFKMAGDIASTIPSLYTRRKNVLMCYQNVVIGSTSLPAYALWLRSMMAGEFAGSVDCIADDYMDWLSSYTLHIENDGYRNNLSRCLINTFAGKMFPEVLIGLSRLYTVIYANLDYQDAGSDLGIINQFNSLKYAYSDIFRMFTSVDISDVVIKDRRCRIDVKIEIDSRFVDSINLSITISTE